VNAGNRSFGSGALSAVQTRGQLGPTSLAELLADAYNFAFTGTLGLEPAGEARSTLWIEHGAVRAAHGPWETDALKEEALSGVLPPDILSLARRHANDYGLELFESIESLKLLGPGAIAAGREALLVHGVRWLAALPAGTPYELSAEATPPPSGVSASLEPLNLILVCVLAGTPVERVEGAVAALGDHKVSLDPIGARSLLATLSGPIRSVVDGLMRSPLSVEELTQRRTGAAEPLFASLYVLWLTHHLRVFDAASTARPPAPAPQPAATSRPPASAARGPRFMAPSVSGIPPRHSATVSDVAPRDPGFAMREHRVKERAMEAKVEEAWSLAQADPSSVVRLTSFVRKAAALYPRNTRIGYHLACLYELDARSDDARLELERILMFDPDFEEAQSLLARLRGGGASSGVGARLKRLFRGGKG